MEKQIQTVNFHNQTLITLQKDGVPYVAMKPVCENIGLDWEAQRQRINRDEVLSSTACMIKAIATDNKVRELLCLPIHYLNGWLFGVDVSRVKAEIKQKLITYKKECYQALFDYWNNGVAVNPRLSSEDTLPLRNAVNMATGILKLDYATIYKMVHQRFGITDNKGSKIKTLTKEQIPQAVEYVHHLILTHKDTHTPIKGIDPQMFYDTLAECAVRLQEFCTVLAQLELLGYQHQDNHYHPCFERPISPPAKAHNGLVDLVNALNLRNKYGVPMFVNKQINWYDGNSTTYICQ